VKNYLLTGILVFAITTISLSLLSEQVLAQSNMSMSPRQQMSMLNDPNQIQCRDDFVMMMRGTTGSLVCINPDTSLRLADRGWGIFDMNMMMNNNPSQLQGITNSMMKNPNTSKLWYDISDNPNTTQSVVDQMTSSMRQNPQKMNPMMNFMMNDPDLRQKMVDSMMKNSQMMQSMRDNNQIMSMMKDNSMMDSSQGINSMMSDPNSRQQMMDKMMDNPQMMHDMMKNKQMMSKMKGKVMMDSMGQGKMMQGGMMKSGNMTGMNQGMMGQGMRDNSMMDSSQGKMATMTNANIGTIMNDPQVRQDMMKTMMDNPQMMQDMMKNKQMMSKMGMMKSGVNNNWKVNNPQMMQDVMSQIRDNPELMAQMNEMMLNNPWNMKGMMNNMQGPMMSSIMNDSELRQHMMDTMITNQQFMSNIMQNQDFMQQLNQ